MLNASARVDRARLLFRRLRWGWRVTRRHGAPSLILHFKGGLGDLLLLTCAARELKRRGERCIWIESRHPELFLGNPDISHVIPDISDDVLWLMRRTKGRIPVLDYAPHLLGERRDTPPSKHLIALMCEKAGISGEIKARPYVSLSEAEITAGKHGVRQVVIQTTGRSATNFMWTKEWYPERFQKVVDELKREVSFVHIGNRNDPPLEGAIDLRGKTTIRQTAAVLAASELFVGLVGFPMHLARAVECPSVIVFGGRELPSQSGYSANHNLVGHTACSPCWRYDDCPGQRACMDQITTETVVQAIRQRLSEGRRALVEDVLTL